MREQELIALLVGVIEKNTAAMEKVAVAVQNDADASLKMSIEVKGLRKTVGLAQQKVGGELGAVIERAKLTQAALEDERREVAHAGSQAAKRGSTDARP